MSRVVESCYPGEQKVTLGLRVNEFRCAWAEVQAWQSGQCVGRESVKHAVSGKSGWFGGPEAQDWRFRLLGGCMKHLSVLG